MQNDENHERCVICGIVREKPLLGTASDHLRTLRLARDNKTLESGYFRPRLTDDERFSIASAGGGEQLVCSNRSTCRARRRSARRN